MQYHHEKQALLKGQRESLLAIDKSISQAGYACSKRFTADRNLASSMRIICRDIWHLMSEQRLPHFIINANSLQACRERVPEVVKVKIDDLCPFHH